MKSEKKYLVGFKGSFQDAIYSKEGWSHVQGDGGLGKMTLFQAKKFRNKNMPEAIIYEVVPRPKL